MLIKMKKIIKKLIFRNETDPDAYIKYLREKGARIGERVCIFNLNATVIDETRPWLLNIGNDVQIASGVTILTHGYDWSVLKGKYGDVLGSAGAVTIGNNVFIGMNTTILKGVHIGNNVIIGAGSLVNKNIPDDTVVAGNPARVISTLDAYYEKRKAAQEKEAAELVTLYRERYGREPDEKALYEFFFLYENGDRELHPEYARMMQLVGTEELSYQRLKSHAAPYSSKEDFLAHIK